VQGNSRFSRSLGTEERNLSEAKNDFNSGIRGGLFEKKHSDAMGQAVFLFGWLVTRQTKPDGLVYGGHHFTYPEISEKSGWPVRTLQRWMERLVAGGYVKIEHTAYCRMIIRVLSPKKFAGRQLRLPMSSPPLLADSARASDMARPPVVADTAAKSGGLKDRSGSGSEKSKDKTRCAARSGTLSEQEQRRRVGARDLRLQKTAEARKEALAGKGPDPEPGTRVSPKALERYMSRGKQQGSRVA
jgi:hypothetical protein